MRDHDVSRRTRLAPIPSRGLRLQTVAANFMIREHAGSERHEALKAAEIRFVARKEYTPEDVALWCDILLASDHEQASQRILSHSVAASRPKDASRPLPWFVPLILLNRPMLSPESVRNLLEHAWCVVRLADMAPEPRPNSRSTRSSSQTAQDAFKLMLERLHRHVLRCLPEAILNMSRLFNAWYGPSDTSTGARLQRKTLQYNDMLRALSQPPAAHPFLYAPLLQQAQFDCLRVMAGHEPPLMLSRTGYQSIVATQLMSRKTDNERDWAELKSKSWPPWKEDKTGLDAEKNAEYGTSKALEAIRRSRETGYGSLGWEAAAHVLAGFDVDQSPTIQTRALQRPPSAAELRMEKGKGRLPTAAGTMWAARIQATRTLPEAWAAFLSWTELPSQERSGASRAYANMLQKVAFDAKRRSAMLSESAPVRRDQSDRPAVLPGDAKETIAAPESPRDNVYTRIPPPSLDELAEMMMREHPQGLTGECLCILLEHTDSLALGIKYMRAAARHHPALLHLLAKHPQRADLETLPRKYFTAFLQLLCNQSARSRRTHREETSREAHIYRDPLAFAWWLLLQRYPQYPPAWYVLLEVLSKRRSIELRRSTPGVSWDASMFQPWKLMQATFREMKKAGMSMDSTILRLLCTGLEKACVAALDVQASAAALDANEAQGLQKAVAEANTILEYGATQLHVWFVGLFGNADATTLRAASPSTPGSTGSEGGSAQALDVLSMPHPQLLHRYIRALGTLCAWDRLLLLLAWMNVQQQRVSEVARELNNGQVMLRRCVVALRIYMDITWASGLPSDSTQHGMFTAEGRLRPPFSCPQYRAPSRETVWQMQALVIPWGGWPSRSECEDYWSGGLGEESDGAAPVDRPSVVEKALFD